MSKIEARLHERMDRSASLAELVRLSVRDRSGLPDQNRRRVPGPILAGSRA